MFVLVLIAPIVILNRIIRHETVGLETILGAICVYVLIAIAFAGIYGAVNDGEPNGFFAQQIAPNNVDFLYFSFVTITTVGYGDLTAGTSTGRVLVTFEALIGQIFLVTLVARLVSMYGTPPATRRATALTELGRRAVVRSSRSSASCTALSAAPLRRLSPVTHRSRVFACDGSSRSRPTSTGSMPAPSSGVGEPSPPSTSCTPGASASSAAASARDNGCRELHVRRHARGRRTPAPARRWR